MEAGIDIARQEYRKSLDEAAKLNDVLGLDKLKSSLGSVMSKSGATDYGEGVLMSMEEHPFWKKFNSDPDYREEIIQYIKSNMEKAMQNQEQYNKEQYRIKFTDF